MVYQGDLKDVDQRSIAGEVVTNVNEGSPIPAHDPTGLSARVMQELRINEQQEGAPVENSAAGLLQPDQSSSRLTDMLHGVSPQRNDSVNDFRINCPSAVPSPLHRIPSIRGGAPVQAMDSGPHIPGPGPVRLPFTPKTIDDHFYMTNEHLDVLGKASWDHIEAVRKALFTSASTRQTAIMNILDAHFSGIKMQIDSVSEKADRTTEQNHNIHTKLDELFDFIKGDVMGALSTQNKQTAALEKDVKELQKVVQNVQQALEKKHSETVASQQHPSAALTPAPVHRSQTSLAGYYGNTTEAGREGQPFTQHLPSHGSNGYIQEPHNDPRAAYGGSYGQQWGPRASYTGRGSKEDRPYSATNPYNFANGATGGAQYGNGYTGGYS